MKKLITYTVISILLISQPALAVSPAEINKGLHLEEVGSGKYTKIGISIYEASLWAEGGEYNKNKPYALMLHYLRSLSKERVVSALFDDIKAQKKADDKTMEEWRKLLAAKLPEMKKGDEIIAMSVPGQPAQLYLNGRKIISIKDKRLSDSFFNIWLGDVANEKLRSQLLSNG